MFVGTSKSSCNTTVMGKVSIFIFLISERQCILKEARYITEFLLDLKPVIVSLLNQWQG